MGPKTKRPFIYKSFEEKSREYFISTLVLSYSTTAPNSLTA